MRAVVLVGGEGTRLRPLTLTTPKQMLPVAGRPMIERVLAHLRGHGIDEVVLSLGYRPDAFRERYPDGHCAGVRLVYAVEDEPLDTAGAVAFAARQAAIGETFVVVNGDVLTGLDVRALVAFHQARRASGSVALTPVDDPSAFGVVVTDPDGRVTAFIEKPRREDAPTNLINAGTYVLEPDVLERIPSGRRVSIERETFPALVASGGLYAMASDEPWVDVGTPAKYLQANLDLGAADHAFPGARVVASVLGEGVEVAEEAVVERSVVLEGARIGRGATVLDSIVGPHAVIGAGATLDGLSVVGAGVQVAAGQSVAGERVPESVPR